jgi:hypothetical protein
MLDYARSRMTIYRKYKRLLKAINSLRENRILREKDFQKAQTAIEMLYVSLKSDRKKNRPKDSRPVGRPKSIPEISVSDCGNHRCKNKRAIGQKYCSKECAPCGLYGVPA